MAERARSRGRLRGLAAAATAVLTALAACGAEPPASNGIVAMGEVVDEDGMNGAVLTEPYTWPHGILTDTTGAPFDVRAGLDKPLTLVFFGYTRCPDICQAVMADVSSALARLDPAEADQIAMWFLTTDPARDTSEALEEYLGRFDPSYVGLTGPLHGITRVAKAVHVPIEKGRRLPSGGYEVAHGTPILAVLPDGTVPMLWTEGTSASALAEDFSTIVDTGIPSVPGEEG